MIDIRSIANNAIQNINPDENVSILVSNGYAIGFGRKQIPAYHPPVSGVAQIQALDGEDLRQLDGLNIQGVIRAAYLRGELAGVIRPRQVGGDVMMRGAEEWLIVKVLEQWPTWVKVAIVLQGD